MSHLPGLGVDLSLSGPWEYPGSNWHEEPGVTLKDQVGETDLGSGVFMGDLTPVRSKVLKSRGSKWEVKTLISVFLNKVVLLAFWRNKSLSFGAVLCTPPAPSSREMPGSLQNPGGTAHTGKFSPGPLRIPLGKKKVWICGKSCPRDTKR